MIEIVRLARRADWVATLAQWHGREWSHLYENWNGATALAEFLAEPVTGLPVTLVAVEAGELCGSVSVVVGDLPGARSEWNPWLASLYVVPQMRRRGVGSALVAEAVALARREGVPDLYCLTEREQRFFEREGFRAIAETTMCGNAVTVLVRGTGDLTCAALR